MQRHLFRKFFLQIKHPDDFGINDTIIKMCTPDPENTFENELENTVIEVKKKLLN